MLYPVNELGGFYAVGWICPGPSPGSPQWTNVGFREDRKRAGDSSSHLHNTSFTSIKSNGSLMATSTSVVEEERETGVERPGLSHPDPTNVFGSPWIRCLCDRGSVKGASGSRLTPVCNWIHHGGQGTVESFEDGMERQEKDSVGAFVRCVLRAPVREYTTREWDGR